MTTQPEALRLADWLDELAAVTDMGRMPHPTDYRRKAAAELRRLHAENASLAAALASSCDEQRHQLWESGGVAGCERARVAERQRDALLEVLRKIGQYTGDGPTYSTPWQDIVVHLGQTARAAIKAVEEGK